MKVTKHISRSISELKNTISTVNTSIQVNLFTNIFQKLSDKSNFDIIVQKQELMNEILEILASKLNPDILSKLTDATRAEILQFLTFFTDLESSTIRKSYLAKYCKIIPILANSPLNQEIILLFQKYLLINNELDLDITIEYIKEIFAALPSLDTVSVNFYWTFTFENVFCYYLDYKTDYSEKITVKHSKNLKNSYKKLISDIISDFLLQLIKINHPYKPFLTDNKATLTGLAVSGEIMDQGKLLYILRYYFTTDIICCNQEYVDQPGHKHFWPYAYVCNYDCSVSTFIINVFDKLSIDYVTILLCTLIRFTHYCNNLYDI